MSVTRALALVMLAWLAIGVMTGIAMGRRGHDRFTWTALGATLGPLAVPLALSTQRRTAPTVGPAARTWPPESSRDPGRGRSPRVAAAWLLGWIDRIHSARVSRVAEPKLDVEIVWPQLSFGHGELSGGCNIPASRPERPTRSTDPSARRWPVPRWRTPAGRWP